jgi:hypothetical protein
VCQVQSSYLSPIIYFAFVLCKEKQNNHGVAEAPPCFQVRTVDVALMPSTRAVINLLTRSVENPQHLMYPKITWGRTIRKALLGYSLSSAVVKWRTVSAYRYQWRTIRGSKEQSTTKETPTLFPHDISSSDILLFHHE